LEHAIFDWNEERSVSVELIASQAYQRLWEHARQVTFTSAHTGIMHRYPDHLKEAYRGLAERSHMGA
jgi:hypothetical protein